MENKITELINLSNEIKELNKVWKDKSKEFLKRYPKIYVKQDDAVILMKVKDVCIDAFNQSFIIADDVDKLSIKISIFYLDDYKKTWSFYKKDLM